MDNLQLCAFYVHMLVYINDYKSTDIDFAFLNLVNIMNCPPFFSHDATKTKYAGLGWLALHCQYYSIAQTQ